MSDTNGLISWEEGSSQPQTEAREQSSNSNLVLSQDGNRRGRGDNRRGGPSVHRLHSEKGKPDFVQLFKGGVQDFQSMLQDIQGHLQSEREKLLEERRQLCYDRARFEEESKRVAGMLHNSDQITLNVGGYKYTTSLATLRNAPSPCVFSAMFSGRYEVKESADGSVFIDRDGRHFHKILNFLRDGTFTYRDIQCHTQLTGQDVEYLLDVRAEADYYGLQSLVDIIDVYPYHVTTVSRSPQGPMEVEMWVYEEGVPDEIAFSVDSPCQLLGVGLCGPHGAFVVTCQVYELEGTDSNFQLAAQRGELLAEASETYTCCSGQIVPLMWPRCVQLQCGKSYVISAHIKGQESSLVEECMPMVMSGGVRFSFHDYESQNGTSETRGQIPELYVRLPTTNAYGQTSSAARQASAPPPTRVGSQGRALGLGEEAGDTTCEGARPKESRNVYAANG